MRKSSLIKLHAAVTIFASRGGCSAQEIADVLGMTYNTVYHLAKMPEWDEALDAMRYEGDRQFTPQKRRDPLKDSPERVAQARTLYIDARRDGQKHSRAVNAVMAAIQIKDRRTINQWAKRFNWEADV